MRSWQVFLSTSVCLSDLSLFITSIENRELLYKATSECILNLLPCTLQAMCNQNHLRRKNSLAAWQVLIIVEPGWSLVSEKRVIEWVELFLFTSIYNAGGSTSESLPVEVLKTLHGSFKKDVLGVSANNFVASRDLKPTLKPSLEKKSGSNWVQLSGGTALKPSPHVL